ncbi:unnamed protein product [Symbiodinium pilosum]|uniref:SH3b domain-containing protein n=1 Tax=Symbiodinium pilosum TaxID=2952 RepID=A0A812NRG8_SYMPI|nr:unnamed protein product [Symbiodinium pilosum]
MTGARRSRFGQWAGVSEGSGDSVPQEAVTKEVPVKRPQPRTKPPRQDSSRNTSLNPRWIRVVFQPRVAVRKSPSLTAPTVTFLDAGEVVEIVEVKSGWVRLAEEEKDDRDVSEDCDAWVLQDGKEVSLGVLCEDWEPRWFCVVYEPQVAVRKKPSLQAHPVAFLKTGEIIQAAEVSEGWIRLSDEDRRRLDVSEDCGAWVLINGHAKGLGRLLAASPPPPEQLRPLEEA